MKLSDMKKNTDPQIVEIYVFKEADTFRAIHLNGTISGKNYISPEIMGLTESYLWEGKQVELYNEPCFESNTLEALSQEDFTKVKNYFSK
jgi:hypothetical protein